MSKFGILGRLGLKIAEALVPGVQEVEDIAKALPGLKGKAKQDKVVDLVRAGLTLAEGATDKDLLADAEVEDATRKAIDAIVALDKIVELKKAARAAAASGTTGE